ncbi:hypothetical protein IWW34DRAFT_823364 [Fusarium oxysporum f. sp. albedinis]|nr:hypothetical protein IWW34DRAFT_823364 [Fusarium oxysporum f. sp. albedinis]
MALTGLYVMSVDFPYWDDEFGQPGEDEEPQVLPRCCLCCFKFEPCDSIVVLNPRNPHLLDPWAGEYIEPEHIDPTGWEFACRRPLEKGYHPECVHLVAKGLPFGDSIHCAIKDRTSYGVGYTELLPSVEAARVRRLKKRFAQELMAIVGYRLPFEICENIGRYCLSGYATKLINDAQHVEFEGLQYIKSLSTTRKSESDTKLFEATSGIRVSVYFAEDCLGIREVVVTQDDNTTSLNRDKGLRWVVNRRKALPFSFKYKTDGLKLRDLAITERKNEMADYRQRRWAVLPDGLDISQLAPPPPGRNNEPIRAVDWNLPGCRGYSVLIDEQSICDIISNNMGGPSSQLVDMRTNKGRSFVLGFQTGEASKFTYQPITTLSPTDPSRMLCCKSNRATFWLGFEQATTWDQHTIDISLPKPSKSTAYPGEGFFASTAELRDVRTVAVCRNWRYSKDVGIVGMLLTYADGHQRSLGQIRLDYMEAPLMVASGKIWLGCDKSKNVPLPDGFWPPTNKIKWLEVDEPLRDKNREYFELPLTGSLEWQSYRCWEYTCHSRMQKKEMFASDCSHMLILSFFFLFGICQLAVANSRVGVFRWYSWHLPGTANFRCDSIHSLILDMDTSSLTWSDKYFPDAPVNHSYERERHEDFGGRAQFLVKDAEVTSGRQHSLLPPVSWTKRRTRWIKESIAADLRQAINGGLPEEICQYIANFCMCERACLILRELWLDPNRPNCWIKSLFIGRNNSIWAKNMEVEGLRYVRSLSTRRLTQQDALVFETRYRKRGARNRPEACLIIYYSEDHGGIREVIITEDNELPSLNMEPGLSWSISRHQDTLLQFVLRYDDIKLRFLTVAQTLEHDMRYEQRSRGVLPERFDSLPQNGDGRRRCVGQVRLDCLDLPLPPVPNDNTRYIKIPFSGRLEWAVFGFASAVRHVEGGEPCDEIGQVMAGRKNVLDYASPDIKTFAVPIRGRENRS